MIKSTRTTAPLRWLTTNSPSNGPRLSQLATPDEQRTVRIPVITMRELVFGEQSR